MVIFTITNHLINHGKPFDQGQIQKVGWGGNQMGIFIFWQCQMPLNNFFFLIHKFFFLEDLGVGQGHPLSPQTRLRS
jgi:hypothetical protein